MSVAEEEPASRKPPDAILVKVLEAVPFQLTTDGGVEAARQRFRDLPRRSVHPDAAGKFVLDGLPWESLTLRLRGEAEVFRLPTIEHEQ